MAQAPKTPQHQPQHQPAKPPEQPKPAQPAQPQQQPPQSPQPSQSPGQQPGQQPRGQTKAGGQQPDPTKAPDQQGVEPEKVLQQAEPVRDERDDPGPDRGRGRDKTGKIPGTPWTPPEGHDHAEPAPGEPGGVGAPQPAEGGGEGGEGGRSDQAPAPPPVHTIADEQRARSAEVQKAGMQKWVEEHDDRLKPGYEAPPAQVPGVAAHRPEAHEARP